MEQPASQQVGEQSGASREERVRCKDSASQVDGVLHRERDFFQILASTPQEAEQCVDLDGLDLDLWSATGPPSSDQAAGVGPMASAEWDEHGT